MIGSYVSLYDHRRANDDAGIDTQLAPVPPDLSVRLLLPAPWLSIERVAYRPVRNSKRLPIALISAISMSTFLQNYVSLTEGSRDVALLQPV